MLSQLPKQEDPNLLVGFEAGDDAGVYRLSKHLALVQTVDFFTPIVDDPYEFGQISAVNSLSDIYAMGATPISALTVVGFPRSGRDFGILEKILEGGLSVMKQAHCAVVGGHSIGDEEIKFGYAVTGLVDPDRVIRNVGAKAGDVLILTKPLGTGVISTALKQNLLDESTLRAAVTWMKRLNRDASEIARRFEVHAMTDVTGFGLLGHARAMALGSGVSFEFDHSKVPVMEGALDCIRKKTIPGGLHNNRKFLEPMTKFEASVDEEMRLLLFDPQTSGGLLMAVAPSDAERMSAEMREKRIPATTIGKVKPKSAMPLHVR